MARRMRPRCTLISRGCSRQPRSGDGVEFLASAGRLLWLPAPVEDGCADVQGTGEVDERTEEIEAGTGRLGAVAAGWLRSGTYFSCENCDVLQTAEGGAQSCGGEVRSGWRTQFPIRPASRSTLSAPAPWAGAAPQKLPMESSKAFSSVKASLSWRMRAASASLPAHSRTDA